MPADLVPSPSATAIQPTSEALTLRPLGQRIKELLLFVADDAEMVEALAMGALDAEEFAESYRVLAQAAIERLHDAACEIAKLRATHRRAVEDHARLRSRIMREAA